MGEVRIGVAVSDPEGLLATPLETVPAGPHAMTRLAAIVADAETLECVVGLPLSLSGREGPAAAKVREFATRLREAITPVPVRLVDERMSTMTAESQLRESGRSGAGKRAIIDQAAAAVILQAALDAERTRGTAPGEIW